MSILKYKPKGFWMLDTSSVSSSFPDLSGYGLTATQPNNQKQVSLVSGAAWSEKTEAGRAITFQSSVYNPGTEGQPFSLMATIYPVKKTTSSAQQILSSSATYDDGLSINGTIVSFATRYTNTGYAKASYDLGQYRAANLMGVHTNTKNMLFVDGVLVDEIDISAAQQADTYFAPNNNLYCGSTSGGNSVLFVNAIGMFPHALSPIAVKDIHNMLRNQYKGSVPMTIGGTNIAYSKDVRKPYLDITVDADVWRTGVMRNVSIEYGQLVPDMYSGVTVTGTWNKSFDLYYAGTPAALHSVNLQWRGKNVTVEASVDGITWVTATSAVNLSNIPVGFDPTNKVLMIRVTFLGGQTEAYIENFTINGYRNIAYVPPNGGRNIGYGTNVVTFPDRPTWELRDDWGARVTGNLSISADSSESAPDIRTIEVWAKKNTTTNFSLSVAPTETYVNGTRSASFGLQGEWAIYHFVVPAGTTSFSFTGNDTTFGRIATYPFVLNTRQVIEQNMKYAGVYGVIDYTTDATGTLTNQTNYHTNPSFTTDLSGWSNPVNCTQTRNTTTFLSSPASLALTATSANTSFYTYYNYPPNTLIAANPNDLWKCSAFAYTTKTGLSAQVYLEAYDVSNNQILNAAGPGIQLTANTWTQLDSVWLKLPANTVKVGMAVYVGPTNVASGDVVYFDDAAMLQMPFAHVDAGSTISITESTPPALIYAHDWSISSA